MNKACFYCKRLTTFNKEHACERAGTQGNESEYGPWLGQPVCSLDDRLTNQFEPKDGTEVFQKNQLSKINRMSEENSSLRDQVAKYQNMFEMMSRGEKDE